MRLLDYRTGKYHTFNKKPKTSLLNQKEFMAKYELNFKLLNQLVKIGWLEKYVGDNSIANAQYRWTCRERKNEVARHEVARNLIFHCFFG